MMILSTINLTSMGALQGDPPLEAALQRQRLAALPAVPVVGRKLQSRHAAELWPFLMRAAATLRRRPTTMMSSTTLLLIQMMTLILTLTMIPSLVAALGCAFPLRLPGHGHRLPLLLYSTSAPSYASLWLHVSAFALHCAQQVLPRLVSGYISPRAWSFGI